AFFEDGKIKKGEVSGGPTQIICEASMPFGGGTWNRDGVIVFAAGGILYRVPAAGGQATAITALDLSEQETEHLTPSFLPDGRHYLYLALSSKPSNDAVYVGSLDSKERKRLFLSSSRAVYAAPGYLLFNRGNAVFAQLFDVAKLTLSGEPIRLADGVPLVIVLNGTTAIPPSVGRMAAFAVSQTGMLLYRTGAGTQTPPAQGQRGNVPGFSLIWIDRSGLRKGAVGTEATYTGVDLSPDGKHVAVHSHQRHAAA